LTPENKTAKGTTLPGFRHIVEAAVFFGAAYGITDVSFLLTSTPNLSEDILLALRFMSAGIIFTIIPLVIYLTIVFLILKPIASVRKWSLASTLTWLYTLALIPAGLVIGRSFALLLAGDNILATDLKFPLYFFKYLVVIVPVCWAVGFWLAGVRVHTEKRVLTARLSAITVGVLVYLVGSIHWQYVYVIGLANTYSEVMSKPENLVITLVTVLAALLIWPVAHWIFSLMVRVKNGMLIGVFWIVAIIIIYIPLLFVGDRLAGTVPSGAELSGRPSNVLVITLDTTRYDELGFNGNEVVETPNLDALAGDSIVFDNAITPIPLTGPSHSSMFTGLQPDLDIGHGVKANGIRLPGDVPTLASILDSTGYNTGAVVSGYPMIRESSGLERGFHYFYDIFYETLPRDIIPSEFWFITAGKIFRKFVTVDTSPLGGRSRDADEVTDLGIKWLEENGGEPFFLFLHYFDSHYLYGPPPPYDTMYMPEYNGKYKDLHINYFDLVKEIGTLSPDDHRFFRSQYRGEISFMDHEIGRLMDWGAERDLWDNTLIIVLADHGESFEHDYYFSHPARLYEHLIHVPCMVRNPDQAKAGLTGQRIDTLVNVSDVFFTVLDFLNLEPPESVGSMHESVPGALASWDHSLPGLAVESHGENSTGGGTGWEYIASQSYTIGEIEGNDLGRFFSYRYPGWKMIYGPDCEPVLPMYQYFNVETDPEELSDIFPEIIWQDHIFPDAVESLTAWALIQGKSVDFSDLTPQQRAGLKALGYISEDM
jgi:arylsulfatase